MRQLPRNMRMLPIIAVGWVVIGGIGTVFLPWPAIDAWQAAHGGGRTGSFVLAEQTGCTREDPPRCSWVGDFTSDDGTMARDRLDLDQALAPDATVGQVVAVRYTGGSQVFLDGDTNVWKVPVGMFATFLAAFVVGISMAWYCFGPLPLRIVRRRYRATAAG